MTRRRDAKKTRAWQSHLGRRHMREAAKAIAHEMHLQHLAKAAARERLRKRMIGAAWVCASRMGPRGQEVAAGMKRWSIFMVLWGFVMPGINNAAHLGGFVVGAGLARVVPVGITQTVAGQRISSLVTLAGLATVVACTGLMLAHLKGFPAALPDDMESRTIFGRVYADGAGFDESGQKRALTGCLQAVRGSKPPAEQLQRCELNARVNPMAPDAYRLLAYALELNGRRAEAARVLTIAPKAR